MPEAASGTAVLAEKQAGQKVPSLIRVRQAGLHVPLVLTSSLKKMTVGMFLASMAFVVAAIVQVEIDVSLLLGSASSLSGLGEPEGTRGLSPYTEGVKESGRQGSVVHWLAL